MNSFITPLGYTLQDIILFFAAVPHYVGCFYHLESEFSSPQSPRDAGLTPASCVQHCKELHHPYAALKVGQSTDDAL